MRKPRENALPIGGNQPFRAQVAANCQQTLGVGFERGVGEIVVERGEPDGHFFKEYFEMVGELKVDFFE